MRVRSEIASREEAETMLAQSHRPPSVSTGEGPVVDEHDQLTAARPYFPELDAPPPRHRSPIAQAPRSAAPGAAVAPAPGSVPRSHHTPQPVRSDGVAPASRSVPPAQQAPLSVRAAAVDAPTSSRPGLFLSARIDDAYLVALGGVTSVPRLAVQASRVASLALEPQAAFVLSRIDGGSSIEDVIDMSGLSRSETIRILHELLKKGVIRTGA